MDNILPIVILNIVEAVKATMLRNKNEIENLLIDNKVHISIIKKTNSSNVTAKVIKIAKSKPQQHMLPALSEKIKLGKKLLKANSNILSLFILTSRIKEYIGHMNLKELTPEGLELVKKELSGTLQALTKVNNQLVKL